MSYVCLLKKSDVKYHDILSFVNLKWLDKTVFYKIVFFNDIISSNFLREKNFIYTYKNNIRGKEKFMATDSLQSLMSAKIYAEYDRIRKEDGGLNPNIVDSDKGRKELGDLLANVRQSIKSSKADIVLLKAFAKIYDNNPTRLANEEHKGTIYENDTFANILSDVGFSNYAYICSTGNDSSTIDTPREYQLLNQLLKIAKQESAFSSEDLIMYKALLDVASDYAPKSANKPSWTDRFKPKPKQKDEEKPAVPTPSEPKSEKSKPKETAPKVQPKPQKTKPKQVKPQRKQPKKVQNNQSKQSDTTNNTGINNSFNNNSGVIIIK